MDQFITDPMQAKAIEQALLKTRVETTTDYSKVWLELNTLPVKLAMKVFVIDQDTEHLIGHLLLDENQPRQWHLIKTRKHFKLSPDVHVELRPSQDIADHRRNIATYWGQTLRRNQIKVNAPYNVPFNMDQSLASAMTKAVTVNIQKRDSQNRLDITYGFNHIPVSVDYIPLYLIDEKWQRNNQFFDNNPRVVVSNNGSFGHGTSLELNDDQQTVSIRLVPNIDWEANSQNKAAPWGYAIEFLDIPLPEIGKPYNQSHTGNVIFPDDAED